MIAEEAYKQFQVLQEKDQLSRSQEVRVKEWLDLMEEVRYIGHASCVFLFRFVKLSDIAFCNTDDFLCETWSVMGFSTCKIM